MTRGPTMRGSQRRLVPSVLFPRLVPPWLSSVVRLSQHVNIRRKHESYVCHACGIGAYPHAGARHRWSTAFLPAQSVNGNLFIGYYLDSTDGISWRSHIRQAVGLMAIYGTPVPEPSSCLLFVSGAVCFVWAHRCCKNRARVLEAGSQEPT